MAAETLVVGMVGALSLWEACFLPSLLNNCGTWISIREETIKKLDALKNMCFLTLLKMPHKEMKKEVKLVKLL